MTFFPKAELKKNSALLTILLIAALLRLLCIDHQSLWMDEIFTLKITNPALNFKQFLTAIEATEGFPYFYYFILRGFYIIFGYSGFSARLLSALAGIVSVYIIYLLVKKLYNKNAGLLAALLLAINEFNIFYSQEARSYEPYMLAVLFSFYRFVLFVKQPGQKNMLLYALSGVLLLNTSFFGAVNLLSQYIVLAGIFIFSDKGLKKQIFIQGITAAVISILFFLPNLPILKKMLSVTSFWIGPPQPDSFRVMFFKFFGEYELTMFIFGCLIVFYFLTLFKKQERILSMEEVKNDKDLFTFLLLLSWFTVFMIIMQLKSYLGASIILERYFISLVPVMIIVAAIALSYFKNRVVQYALTSCICIFSLFNLVFIKKFYTSLYKGQYRETAHFIEQNNKDKHAVFTSLKHMYEYYFNDTINNKISDVNLDVLLNEMASDSLKRKPFWYADAHRRNFTVTPEHQEFLNKHFILNDNFEGFDAWARHYVLKTNDLKVFPESKIKDNGINNTDVKYIVDDLNLNGTELNIRGWAVLLDQDAVNAHISVILVKDDNGIELPTEQESRKDVTNGVNNGYNLDNSGFKYKGSLKNVSKGHYIIGIYIQNKIINKDALVITDRNIVIE